MKIKELLDKGYEILKESDIEYYKEDCLILLSEVINKEKLFIITNRESEVSEELSKKYFKYIHLRKNRMPIKYIMGSCEFMGLDLFIKEGVLIPRVDTEILVEEVLKHIEKNKYFTVCDVCTGSGAIAISIAKYSQNVKVECSDISNLAKEVTEKNIDKFNLSNKVKFTTSDLLQHAIEGNKSFDVIVSNPPYIREAVIPTLMEDVKNYEPHLALNGGEDGLDFYKKITYQSLKVLNKGGLLAFEIGYDQREDVKNILEEYNFKDIKCIKDLARNDRVVIGTKC